MEITSSLSLKASMIAIRSIAKVIMHLSGSICLEILLES